MKGLLEAVAVGGYIASKGHLKDDLAWRELIARALRLEQMLVRPEIFVEHPEVRISEALKQAIGNLAFDCTRVWEAWGVGTMTEKDFMPLVDQEDRMLELAQAALRALRPELSERNILYNALRQARQAAVLAIAFIGRDQGTDRMERTLEGLVTEFVRIDNLTLPILFPGKGEPTPAEWLQEVRRGEDMGGGSLTLFRQDDGDIIVVVMEEDNEGEGLLRRHCIEFCAIGSGGGASPHTMEALRNLMDAMAMDNANPNLIGFRAESRRPEDQRVTLHEALRRAHQKLASYVGVCRGDKELTNTVLPMLCGALGLQSDAPRISPMLGDVLHRLECAWGLIANAHGGDWQKASAEWREAAEKWRDDSWHRTLNECGGHTMARIIMEQESPFKAGDRSKDEYYHWRMAVAAGHTMKSFFDWRANKQEDSEEVIPE